MKLNQKALALCALVALPIGGVMAGQVTGSEAATEIKAADAKTQTINLDVTGMT